jgi:hypothetical protein
MTSSVTIKPRLSALRLVEIPPLPLNLIETARLSLITSRSIKPGKDSDVLTIAGDVADPKTADRIGQEGLARFGCIDTLINNAVIFIAKPLVDYTEEDFTSFSEKADGHSRVCVGSSRAALLYRRPCRNLSEAAMKAKGLFTVRPSLLGCWPPLDK